ncbi:hypothetical protein TNCV_2206981 [Trichonephila clavipes]|uniref:Uncharacterized protein n=1 Tax=Trichonephila clavipes TaxID=2585209 RepID=A0A8X6S0K9_TRICX|nr:hypothetical protein TNCV_2206981 [Trichonephila clavipes]
MNTNRQSGHATRDVEFFCRSRTLRMHNKYLLSLASNRRQENTFHYNSEHNARRFEEVPVPPNILRVHTEYVLVKSGGPKVLWRKFPSASVPCLNCGGGDRWWCHHRNVLSSLREFHRAKSYCHLYGAQSYGQRQAYI